MKRIFNYAGEDITDINCELLDTSFGKIDENGNINPNWPIEDENVDSLGFDKHHQEENGYYKQEVILPKGTLLCRYGSPQGRTTTNAGIPYELLALPYKKETIEYHEYIVIADGVLVECRVVRGMIYPAFNSPGQVVQYVHPEAIESEIAAEKLQEDMSWIKNKKKSV